MKEKVFSNATEDQQQRIAEVTYSYVLATMLFTHSL